MSTLLNEIISGFIKSCVSDLPRASQQWTPPKRALFYLGALLVYPVAMIVAMAVIATVILIVYPVSYIYRAAN
ncbi:MAG: hypothetical protein OXF23_01365 [Candidatus Dadabacteria bacterium]|nr:hypothetical protein [Candidatus Dadabacteria bacterium]MCY4262292.1 hypothetical protein [Candidatus Dadabacteria bacterium]